MSLRTILFTIMGSLFLLACTDNTSTKNSYSNSDITGLLLLAQTIQQTNADTALSLARTALEIAIDKENESNIAQSNLLLGQILYDMGGLSQSIQHLNDALSYFSKVENLEQLHDSRIAISKVYMRSENYTKAYLYLSSALNTIDLVDDYARKAALYGQLGHLYEKRQLYDSALFYQSRALESYQKTGDFSGLAVIHDNIGSIYEDQEEYSKAFYHFNKAWQLNDSIQNLSQATINLNNLGDVFRKEGNLTNALKYSHLAEEYAIKTGQDYQLKSAYRDLSKIYREKGDLPTAFDYLARSYEMTDNIFSDQIAEELARTQSIYELEQKQQRIAFLEKNQHANRIITIISIGSFICFMLLGGLIFYQQRSKNRKERKLLETSAELAKKDLENTQLSEQKLRTELENNMLKEEQLKQELDLKSKSLTNSALHMIQKNEFLQSLRKKLKEIKKSDTADMDKKVKKLIKSIDLNFNMDDDWQEFEAIFQQVHSNFFNRLLEMYPDLTSSEVRLCAMIRLNLHSKDMAAIMGISQDSLRIARYRLRKSLGLEKGANLYSFIINIG